MLIRKILGRWEPAIEFLFPDFCKITIRVNGISGEGFWHSLETERSSTEARNACRAGGGKWGRAYKRALTKLRFFSALEEWRDGCSILLGMDTMRRRGWDERWGWVRQGRRLGRHSHRQMRYMIQTKVGPGRGRGARQREVDRQRTPGSDAKHCFVRMHISPHPMQPHLGDFNLSHARNKHSHNVNVHLDV